MQITQIGPLSINQTTGIEITALSHDHAGTGYDVWPFWRPRRIKFTLHIRRTTREAVLMEIDQLAAAIYSEETKRKPNASVRRGILMRCDTWSVSTETWLGNVELHLLGIEQAANGISARVQVQGVMLHPPISGMQITTTQNNMHSFTMAFINVSGWSNNGLYVHALEIATPNTTAIRDSVIVVESRAATSEVSQTRYLSPTAASNNCMAESMPGGATRYVVTSGTSATVTYDVTTDTLADVPFTIYACVHVPTGMSGTLSVAWNGQPAIVNVLTDKRTWYPIGVHDLGDQIHTITVSVSNVAANTYIFPLLFVPVDGAHLWYVSGATQYNKLQLLYPERYGARSLHVLNEPSAVIYGPVRCVTRRWFAMTHGIAVPDMSTATSDITIASRMTLPSAWL